MQRNNYIFIDFENVQPSNLDSLKNSSFKVIIFVGANQTKIPMELVMSMQSLGENAQYIIINGNGKNALDFHITFYLGQLYEKEPEGYFHVISKDSGFDILINHLKNKNILINRYNNIEEIPLLKTSNCSSLSMIKKIDLIKNYLISRGNATIP
ncbi:MAG: PIN domain-containing protein [Sulfurovum sp.]|nr:PIN domain-containing protein [Sulfurovum sp.]